jgi:AraC-like DNA-binding protein
MLFPHSAEELGGSGVMDQFRINWQLIALTVVAGQALLFALVLLIQNRGNRKANTCLALVVLLLVWHHADFIANTSFWYQSFPYLFTPHYVSWFLFGPLVYLYIRFVLEPEYKPNPGYYWAFLPALISFVNYFGLYALDKDSKVRMIKETVILNTPGGLHYFDPIIPRDVVFTAQTVFLAGFLVICFRLLRHAGRHPGKGRKDLASADLRWLGFVLISFTLAVVISNFYFQAIWLTPVISIGQSVYLYVAPLTVLLILLEVRAFLRPEVYAQDRKVRTAERKYRKSLLSEQEEKVIISRLKKYMEHQKAYLDSELRIGSLSKQLDIPVNHLSQAINQQLQQNFFEFVNTYRVSEARQIIESPRTPKLNLLNIAIEAGFNNKTTFLNAFRKTFQMSPSEYKKSLQQ